MYKLHIIITSNNKYELLTIREKITKNIQLNSDESLETNLFNDYIPNNRVIIRHMGNYESSKQKTIITPNFTYHECRTQRR